MSVCSNAGGGGGAHAAGHGGDRHAGHPQQPSHTPLAQPVQSPSSQGPSPSRLDPQPPRWRHARASRKLLGRVRRLILTLILSRLASGSYVADKQYTHSRNLSPVPGPVSHGI